MRLSVKVVIAFGRDAPAAPTADHDSQVDALVERDGRLPLGFAATPSTTTTEREARA